MVIPWDYWQVLDADALRQHPIASLCLLHSQPPLLNALLAGMLAMADGLGCAPETVASALFLALGLLATIVAYHLVIALTDSRALAVFALLLVLTDPAYQLYAHLFFYEFVLFVLLLLLVAATLRYEEQGRGLLLVGFLAGTITLTRTLFHPLWTVTVCLLVVCSGWREQRPRRRAVASLLLLVLAMISLWPLKNRFVFGRTFVATLSSYSLARGIPGCGSIPLNRYIKTGTAPPSAAELAAGPIDVCGAASASVLLSPTKTDGSRNWNHAVLLGVAEGFDRCAIDWFRHHPGDWLLRGAGQYAMWMRGGYIESYDQSVRGPMSAAYHAYTRAYDHVLYADLRPLAERLHPNWWLHAAAMVRGHPVPYTIFGFVLFPLTLIALLLRWWKTPWSPRDAAAAVALYCIVFAMLGACATDGVEGNRMRTSTSGLFAVVLAYVLAGGKDLLPRFAAWWRGKRSRLLRTRLFAHV